MQLFLLLLLVSFLGDNLYALTTSQRADLLLKVKITKSQQRQELKEHVMRVKQSRYVRSKAFRNKKHNATSKVKQQHKHQIRQQKSASKRVP